MTRYGSLIKIKSGQLDTYRQLHANVWPGVLEMISHCNIRNYSIYYRNGYLFSYFEYTGSDYEADMQRMAEDPVIQKWWDICKPCHDPLPDREPGEWWAGMEEMFHTD